MKNLKEYIMKYGVFIGLLLTVVIISYCGAGNKVSPSEFPIIPRPEKARKLPGTFRIDSKTTLVFSKHDPNLEHNANYLAGCLKSAGGPLLQSRELVKGEKPVHAIILDLAAPGEKGSPESYRIKVSKDHIIITGASGAGVFYGIQTLLQLLPPEICKTVRTNPEIAWEVPCAEISDSPRFSYRGMHLDVSRHFFPKEFVKKYIDLIAMYKMNTFHWHLTDDNGWRIEIKKYPKLTGISAWRVDREDLPWRDRPLQKPGERATYGGFYTQDEIREVVAYAKERYITIIPEIEMPAHCISALAAYPQFSCTGGPFTVPPGTYWPNSEIFCAGNDSVFTFLQDVLTEVMDLFPSKYIHVGGDEADKSRWKACPKCQARIKAEGLKDETELQSYFMKRIEKFIVSKNRKMIGWDEILEGGIAPEATVMSWRGIEGGIEASRLGHDVIMTPSSYCYFDFYQADSKFEPEAIGGFIPLKKVYSFEPVPAELTAAQAKHILGAQGNVWTEFIPIPQQVEYMALPRMIALAEVDWSQAKLRDWGDFRLRLSDQFKRLDYMYVNYSKGSYKVDIRTYFDKESNTQKAILSSEQLNIPILYTLDGNDPKPSSAVYSEPIDLKGNCYIKAGLYVNGTLKEKLTEMPVIIHKATGKKVKYLQPYSYRYKASGDQGLVDGLRGSINHRDGYWQGFQGNDMDVIIDLGKPQPVRSVSITFLHNPDSWIFMPDSVIFSLSSNGQRFHSINEQVPDVPMKEPGPFIKLFSQVFPETVARYVRVRGKNLGVCPPWHPNKGEPCWVFADEIVVY
jgi:hexosaminidase